MPHTKFTKENLRKEAGGYVTYAPHGRLWHKDNKFVARFRRGDGGPGTFMTHLRKHWTVEDYFAKVDEGLAPLQIVELTGYFLPHIKKELKRRGYPLTKAGFTKMIRDDIAASDARIAKMQADPEYKRRKALREKEIAGWSK